MSPISETVFALTGRRYSDPLKLLVPEELRRWLAAVARETPCETSSTGVTKISVRPENLFCDVAWGFPIALWVWISRSVMLSPLKNFEGSGNDKGAVWALKSSQNEMNVQIIDLSGIGLTGRD